MSKLLNYLPKTLTDRPFPYDHLAIALGVKCNNCSGDQERRGFWRGYMTFYVNENIQFTKAKITSYNCII